MRTFFFAVCLLFITGCSADLMAQGITDGEKETPRHLFRDISLPVESRVNDLVSLLTLEEKVQQMQSQAPAIPRLGIPAYNWWSECLHGVARNGNATVFPQAIGMAATWDPALIHTEADAIATEARAKYRDALDKDQHGVYQGLTFYSPNINIFRDPRWGRGQETYGEDPFLTARTAVAFVKGLQGNDQHYYKVVATAKHFAVHSGPESSRHRFDAWCSDRDLYETYLPAFEALVREGGVASVMGAYNRFRNEPCCSSVFLLDEILRKQWGFKGYVTTDCGAIWDIWHGHALQPDDVRAAAMGLRAGSDLTCGDDYLSLAEAVKKGFVNEHEIDVALKRLMTARFRLGMFDPDSLVPWTKVSPGSVGSTGNNRIALQVARESMVLLKNENNLLPLSMNTRSVAVIGPYADRVSVLLGNYNGEPLHPVTILQGIRERIGKSAIVNYAMGVAAPEDLALSPHGNHPPGKHKLFRSAMKVAEKSEVIIFAGGISPLLEGEELQVEIPGFSGGDRTSLDLPAGQRELLLELFRTGKPVILVLTNGSALSVNWEAAHIPAILEAWYPGEAGGTAVADVLFGCYNPAGRLPVTFYRSANDLPPFEDYAMEGRTYKYFRGSPLFPFGYGLSYATFSYSSANTDRQEYLPADTIRLQVKIRNTGSLPGDEVIQVYCSKPGPARSRPVRSLVGFRRSNISAGADGLVDINIPTRELRMYNHETGSYVVEPGLYKLEIGASSGDIRLVLNFRIVSSGK